MRWNSVVPIFQHLPSHSLSLSHPPSSPSPSLFFCLTTQPITWWDPIQGDLYEQCQILSDKWIINASACTDCHLSLPATRWQEPQQPPCLEDRFFGETGTENADASQSAKLPDLSLSKWWHLSSRDNIAISVLDSRSLTKQTWQVISLRSIFLLHVQVASCR